jgi:hypothetical protein
MILGQASARRLWVSGHKPSFGLALVSGTGEPLIITVRNLQESNGQYYNRSEGVRVYFRKYCPSGAPSLLS